LRIALLAIAAVSATGGMVYLTGIVPSGLSGPPTSLAHVILGLVLAVFVTGRVIWLRRGGSHYSTSACAADTVRQSSILLAKVLLVLYFVILFGQLPFRARVTEGLHVRTVNEVRAVMSAPGPSGSSTGK